MSDEPKSNLVLIQVKIRETSAEALDNEVRAMKTTKSDLIRDLLAAQFPNIDFTVPPMGGQRGRKKKR